MRRFLRAVVPLMGLLAVSVAGAASFPMEGAIAVDREKGRIRCDVSCFVRWRWRAWWRSRLPARPVFPGSSPGWLRSTGFPHEPGQASGTPPAHPAEEPRSPTAASGAFMR